MWVVSPADLRAREPEADPARAPERLPRDEGHHGVGPQGVTPMSPRTDLSFGFTLPQRGVFFGATTVEQLLTMARDVDADPLFDSLWVGRQPARQAAARLDRAARRPRLGHAPGHARRRLHGELPRARSRHLRLPVGDARPALGRPHAARGVHRHRGGRGQRPRRARCGAWPTASAPRASPRTSTSAAGCGAETDVIFTGRFRSIAERDGRAAAGAAALSHLDRLEPAARRASSPRSWTARSGGWRRRRTAG